MKNTKKALKRKIKKNFRELVKNIARLCLAIFLISCGSTRVAVQKPAEGTSTTITVTTNNPITTSIPVNADVKLK